MSATNSMKGYIPGLSRALNMTPAALYERQRALVRAGLLDAGEGRGPGSGVKATNKSLALLLLSVLATDNLSEVDHRVGVLASAKSQGSRCPITGHRNLLDAIAAILTSAGLARAVAGITISRTADRAKIWSKAGKSAKPDSIFLGAQPVEPAFEKSATIGGVLLVKIAEDIQAMIEAGIAAEDDRE